MRLVGAELASDSAWQAVGDDARFAAQILAQTVGPAVATANARSDEILTPDVRVAVD